MSPNDEDMWSFLSERHQFQIQLHAEKRKSWVMPAKVLERQRVKIVSLVNTKLTFAHHLSLQEAASLGSTRSQHRSRRWFCEMRDGYTLPLCTLWWWRISVISPVLSLLKPHYSYFHWLENRIYIKVSFTW